MPTPSPPAPDPDAPLLVIDSGSPVVSVAAGVAGTVLALATARQRQASERLVGLIEEVLGEAGIERRQLGGLVGLRGPGSFTGLRVGLATLLGLHQALGAPATALPSLPVLARAAGPATALAAVAATRGEWIAQAFDPGPPLRPRAVPARLAAEQLSDQGVEVVVGFGVDALEPRVRNGATRWIEPEPLARLALVHLAELDPVWDAALLTTPLYLTPPAVSVPGS